MKLCGDYNSSIPELANRGARRMKHWAAPRLPEFINGVKDLIFVFVVVFGGCYFIWFLLWLFGLD